MAIQNKFPHLFTFLILSSLFTNCYLQEDFTDEFKKDGFEVLMFTDHDPRVVNTETSYQVPTHYLFFRGGHSIHLLVFYEREGSFWWHGALSWGQWAKGDPDEVKVNLSHVPFGKHAGAYDK